LTKLLHDFFLGCPSKAENVNAEIVFYLVLQGNLFGGAWMSVECLMQLTNFMAPDCPWARVSGLQQTLPLEWHAPKCICLSGFDLRALKESLSHITSASGLPYSILSGLSLCDICDEPPFHDASLRLAFMQAFSGCCSWFSGHRQQPS
jgi:hypothetical protein